MVKAVTRSALVSGNPRRESTHPCHQSHCLCARCASIRVVDVTGCITWSPWLFSVSSVAEVLSRALVSRRQPIPSHFVPIPNRLSKCLSPGLRVPVFYSVFFQAPDAPAKPFSTAHVSILLLLQAASLSTQQTWPGVLSKVLATGMIFRYDAFHCQGRVGCSAPQHNLSLHIHSELTIHDLSFVYFLCQPLTGSPQYDHGCELKERAGTRVVDNTRAWATY